MEIRRLAPADAPTYREVRLRALRDHPEAFTSSFEEEALKPPAYSSDRLSDTSPAIYWGAFENGALVGTVGLDRETRLKNRHKATVIGMYVAPEAARQGVGRALLAALLAQARALQLELLVLTVTEGNQGAQQLYLEAGFKTFGREPRAIKVKNQYFDKNYMALVL